ncbi:MAG: protein translocase subunit SecD, partial [Deferribacteraceae bacterium]|nr:protein translocase subunit SecD [Deferribacteraceae bacterium]
MNRKFRWLIIVIALALSLFFMLPLDKKIRLGLDLQGGMHVVLGVDTEAAVSTRIETMVYQIRTELQKGGTPFAYVQKSEPYSINIGLSPESDKAKINEVVRSFGLSGGSQSGDVAVYTLESSEITKIRDNAVLQALEVVRNRIDKFGVSEPLVQKQGRDQILVQLPGVTDPDRAINLIGQTAQLKFYLVDSAVTQEDILAGRIPFDCIVLNLRETNRTTGELIRTIPVALKRDVLLTGENLADAGVVFSGTGEAQVSFAFDRAGTRLFADITTRNVGKQLAIVLDDTVYSAPNIQEPITGGQGVITGSFTPETASDLSIVLKAGSLPAPVTIYENRTVGPSLGQESIDSGVKACIVGLALIVVFMSIYYRVSGLVANFGLICNFTVLLGIFCLIGATLTLPGIAGIILTLGIAVDSNVLIFERVREEVRNKRTV